MMTMTTGTITAYFFCLSVLCRHAKKKLVIDNRTFTIISGWLNNKGYKKVFTYNQR